MSQNKSQDFDYDCDDMPAQSTEQKRYRNICFTSFKVDSFDWFKDWTKESKTIVKYIILQGEYTKNQKKHIQGYAEFSKQVSMKQIKAFFGDNGMYIAPRFGTRKQAVEYCKKEKNGRFHEAVEFGEENHQGTSSILVGLRNKIISGQSIDQIVKTTNEDKEIEYCLKFEQSLRRLEQTVKDDEIKAQIIEEEFTGDWAKPWQTTLLDELQLPTDRRKVVWYYDEKGNSGKSELSRYLLCSSSDTYIVTGGKQADILYGYQDQKNVIFDLPRTYVDNMHHIYNVIENFKNGQYFSGKFVSRQRIFQRPHVIIMANFLPDFGALSLDRWDLRVVENNEVIKISDITKYQEKSERDEYERFIKKNKQRKFTSNFVVTNDVNNFEV